jgi:hypothetical protein
MKTRLFTLALSLFLTANITFAQGYIDENGDSIAVVDYKEELDVNPEYTSESTADVIWPDVPVFIIDGNGYGVTIEDWTSDMGAIAVALQTKNVNVRISLTNLSKNKLTFGLSGNINGVARTSENRSNMIPGEQAKTDYAGKSNTDKEVQLLYTNDETVMKLIASFSFPDGANGYVPSLGEMRELFRHQSEINAALRKVGGTPVIDEFYWTSTQHYLPYRIWAYGGYNDDDTRWFAQLRNGNNPIAAQYGECRLHCRPFAELGTPGLRPEQKRIEVESDEVTEDDLSNFVSDFIIPMRDAINNEKY